MKSQPQNPEFRINLENFHPCRVSGTNIGPVKQKISV